MFARNLRVVSALAALALLGAACSSSSASNSEESASGECTTPEVPTLTLAAYSTPREVYGKIIPAF